MQWLRPLIFHSETAPILPPPSGEGHVLGRQAGRQLLQAPAQRGINDPIANADDHPANEPAIHMRRYFHLPANMFLDSLRDHLLLLLIKLVG